MHRQIQRVELICRVLICTLLGFVQISVRQNDFEGSSCSLSSLCLHYTVTVSAVEDNYPCLFCVFVPLSPSFFREADRILPQNAVEMVKHNTSEHAL